MTRLEAACKIMSLGAKNKGAEVAEKQKAIDEAIEVLKTLNSINVQIHFTLPMLFNFAKWLKEDNMLQYDNKHLAEWFLSANGTKFQSLDVGELNTILTAITIAKEHTHISQPGHKRLAELDEKLNKIFKDYAG